MAKFRPKGHHIGFKKLTAELAAEGARNPRALAAYIGRRKYGVAGMAAAAASARAKRKFRRSK